MDIARLVRKVCMAEACIRGLKSQLEHYEEVARKAKSELAYHPDRARAGEPPVVISLRHRLFWSREYFLDKDCSITSCEVLKER